MAIRPPSLDDRGFEDLVQEALARIPAHTPEWTNPRLGDPGRTLIELFAWLTDTLLYRANLIPERQRLAFLRLLGAPMRPAVAASGLVAVRLDDPDAADAVVMRPLASIRGPAPFETTRELTVLPISAEAYIKRPLTDKEKTDLADVIQGLDEMFELNGRATPYMTTPVFPNGAPEPDGVDLMDRSVDKCLWLALLAGKPELVAAVKQTLGQGPNGGAQLLSVGIQPSIALPALFEDIGPRGRVPHVWEITTGLAPETGPEFVKLTVVEDTTESLTRRGVERLALPSAQFIGAPSNDVLANLDAGVGDQPPRIDDRDKADRLVAWLRLRPTVRLDRLSLSWVGINAVEIDQRQTIAGRVVSASTGAADQEMMLPAQSVEPDTFILQVEEPGRGYETWQRIDDLATAGRDSKVYTLDSNEGTVRFGDGLRGRVPEAGRRVRVALMRAGGGRAGNLAPGALTEISGRNLAGGNITRPLKVFQPLAMEGGEDAETLAQAEQRIPAWLSHRNRAVTPDDYQRLAAETPGIQLGRVEVMPRFKPQQRRPDVPGVVSVMTLPFKPPAKAPNPRPDRPTLETVHAYLSQRCPVATELYVIGCEYVPLAATLAVSISDGAERERVLNDVIEALRLFLWPLPPGGHDGNGWQRGRTVREREIEVAVARVRGVDSVNDIRLFDRQGDRWVPLPLNGTGPSERELEIWQLPELLDVSAVEGESAPTTLAITNPLAEPGVAVPVVPKVC